MLDPEFLELLACPRCVAPLRDLGAELECTSAECGLVYAVEDGIPNLLVEEARPGARGEVRRPDEGGGRAAPGGPRPGGSEKDPR